MAQINRLISPKHQSLIVSCLGLHSLKMVWLDNYKSITYTYENSLMSEPCVSSETYSSRVMGLIDQYKVTNQ